VAAYVDAKQEAVRVVIGFRRAVPEMRNFVLIGAPVRAGREVVGSLAVIGPTRMEYGAHDLPQFLHRSAF